MALNLSGINSVITKSGVAITEIQRKSDGKILWSALPDELVVYQATTEGTVSVHNTEYIPQIDREVLAQIWYALDDSTATGAVTIAYGGFKTAVIEYAFYTNNCSHYSVDVDGRHGHIAIGGVRVFDSRDQNLASVTAYTYSGAATSIPVVCYADNSDHEETWVVVSARITKITLKK